MRRRAVVAVWKEKLTYRQSVSAAKEIRLTLDREPWPFEPAIAPNPFSFVGVAETLRESSVRLCAQNVLWSASSGSYIAETTVEMLNEIGCSYVIVGHSERRLHFAETSEQAARRAISAISAGIRPILCVGDTEEERQAGRTRAVVGRQLRALFDVLPPTISPDKLLIAYEPVWAISTWRTAQPLPVGHEVQELHAEVRALISEMRGNDFATETSLLYGGSIAGENAEDYMAQPDVDGGLVGGASKTPKGFIDVLIAAKAGFSKRRGGEIV